MVVPIGRSLVAAEAPILRAHGLSRWGYVVLLRLQHDRHGSQAAMAEAIGADKTRLIGVLDDLQARGLITRERDPNDRRARLLAPTAKGSRLRAAIQAAVRRNEVRILAALPPADRRAFLRALDVLAALPRDAFLPHAAQGRGGITARAVASRK
jgi:DNA-binding MarR family transcriptional regulator